MTPLRVPLHMRLSDIGQLPPGTWTPSSPKYTLSAVFRILGPQAKKPVQGQKIHVRIEPYADSPRVGGETSNLTTDYYGKIQPTIRSTDTSRTLYVSLTPSGMDKAIIWRHPVIFSETPGTATDILLQEGGGLDVKPPIPVPAPTPAPTKPEVKSGKESEGPDWALIAGIGILALGAGFLVYQLYSRSRKKGPGLTPLPVPEEI